MKKKNNQGFSLVELLIAIVILSLIMIALGSFIASTTRVYTRSRNDIEVQRTGQELYDLIADKILQASELRVGRDGKEYASIGAGGSNAADASGRLIIQGSGSSVPVSGLSGMPLYSFDSLTNEETPIDYIAIVYEQKTDESSVTPGGVHLTASYRKMLDIYYFDNTEHTVYMSRKILNVRNDSVGIAMGQGSDAATANAVVTNHATPVTPEAMVLDQTGNQIKLLSTYSVSALSDMLVSKNVETMYAYAIPDENALYLDIQVEKQTMEKNSAGMITVRNSYVLEPKGASDPTDEDAP